MESRMDFVAEHRAEYGLSACLAAVGIAKSTWFARRNAQCAEERDAAVLEALRSVLREHPGYGWRRLQTELQEEHDIRVNHKRLKRILRERALGLARHVATKNRSGPAALLPLHAGSLNLVRGRSFGPFEALSTDFTELHHLGGRKAWLMAIIDIDSKLIVGWATGRTRNRELALDALAMAHRTFRDHGRNLQDVVIHHDKDSVYTSYAWLYEVLLRHGMQVSYSEHGARHNPWIESLWSRFKLENASRIAEATGVEDIAAIAQEHFVYHNHRRRHSALANQSPIHYLTTRGAAAS